MGQSSGEVIRSLLAQGVNRRLLRKLYAGAWGAALCSVLVGAVHFASFETSRRLLLQHMPASAPGISSTGALASATDSAGSSASAAEVAAATLSMCSSNLSQQRQHHQQHQQEEQQQRQGGERWLVNMLAAALAALATAVVESPVELFRHNQQAGLVKGDFMREMASVVRRQGPSGEERRRLEMRAWGL